MKRRVSLMISLTLGLAVLPAAPAIAAPASSGEPLSSTPELLGAPGYGRVIEQDDQTEPNGRTSGYTDCGTTEGAAAYKFTAPTGTVVDVDVIDDASGQSLCAVELFSLTSSSGTLASIYDVSGRADHLVGSNRCALTASMCHSRWTVMAQDTFYLVLWPAGNNTPNFSAFRLTAGVRRPTSTALTVTGPHQEQKSGWFVVTKMTKLSATATVSPGDATSTVRFWIDRYSSGSYRHWSQGSIALSGARASLVINFSLEGLYHISTVYSGDDTSAQSTSRIQGVVVRTPTTQRVTISGYSGIEKNYFVFRRGTHVTAGTVILPSGATGYVTFYWYQLLYEGKYRYLRSYNVPVTRSQAVLRFAPTDPYHFFRIFTFYRGDKTHLPSRTALMCIEFY